jgi:hypothetical protein
MKKWRGKSVEIPLDAREVRVKIQEQNMYVVPSVKKPYTGAGTLVYMTTAKP